MYQKAGVCHKRLYFAARNKTLFWCAALGVYNEKGELEYAGNVGTGFTDASLAEIHLLLSQYSSNSTPFNTKPPGYSKIHRVSPRLVAEVEFNEWTDEGYLRHPGFKG